MTLDAARSNVLARLVLTLAALLAHPSSNAQAQSPGGTGATLEGMVFDSLRGVPLAGAIVLVDPLSRRITTNSAGYFRAGGLPAGVHQLTFQHPVLDTLGTRSPSVSVTLMSGDTTRIDLALPSGPTLLGRLCPPPTGRPEEGRGGVLGVVRHAETDAPVPGATVQLQWRSIVVDPTLGLRRGVALRDAVADASGVYAVCNTPADLTGNLTAAAAGLDTANVEVVLSGDGVAVQHFHLAPTSARAELAGTVRDQSGAPIESAEVAIMTRAGAPAPPLARSDARGSFRLPGARAGTQVVEVKRVGFQPLRHTVALVPGRTTRLALTLTAQPIQLPEVAVKAQTTAERYGFPDRLKRGGGRFYTRDEIARKQVLLSADLVREFPGMRIQQDRGSAVITNQSLRQNITGSSCAIATFVDGVRTATDLVLNIPAQDIDGVEIYNIPENVPSEYAGPNSSCGAILVWTNWRTRR